METTLVIKRRSMDGYFLCTGQYNLRDISLVLEQKNERK